jgi:hypothetical protein
MTRSGLFGGRVSNPAFIFLSFPVHVGEYNIDCILLLNTNPAGLKPILYGVCDFSGEKLKE